MARDDCAGVGSACASRYVGVLAWVDGFINELCGRDRGICGGGEDEAKVAMVATSQGCWDGSGIGFKLILEGFQTFIVWFALNFCDGCREGVGDVLDAWDGCCHVFEGRVGL